MAKCLNCDKDSEYIINNAGTMPQEFCDLHLPKFLTRTNLPTHVQIVNRAIFVGEPEEPEEAPVKTTKKKAAAQPKVEEETATEE